MIGLGDGIVMFYVKNSVVKELIVFFVKSKKGVDYEVLDG